MNGSNSRDVIPSQLKKRKFYSTRNFMPIPVEELGYDSQEEVDEEWLQERDENMIDDFEDCTTTEKVFMKLWNRFVLNRTVTADAQVSCVVIQFTLGNGIKIINRGLEHFFSMHLLHLYGTSLISTADLIRCTDILAKKKELSSSCLQTSPPSL